MCLLNDISNSLQQGRAPKVKELVQQAVDEGLEPEKVLEEGLLAGMSIIGQQFKVNEIFVPEVLIAARAMNAGISILQPYLAKAGIEHKGTVVIGTVRGDIHDIGKNLVKMMMEGKGLRVVDLGVDVPAETFVEAAMKNNANIICCSALLTTTMGEMKNIIDLIVSQGLRNRFKIMIGGAPITQGYCDDIGADCYTQDAASAADEAFKLCQQFN